MIQPKINYKKIIYFLLGLTFSYFIIVPGIKFTKIKWVFIESVNDVLNNSLDHFFLDTYLYLHTADQTSRKMIIGPYQLKLPPVQFESKYDTQLNLLNKKNILSLSSGAGEKLPIQNQKVQLSIWDLWLLPSLLVFCLSISFPATLIKRILLLLISFCFLQLVNLLRLMTVLVLQINLSEHLSPISLSAWQKKLISFSTLFHGIESIYILTFLSWLCCWWLVTKIFSIKGGK
ncbi:MAG: hypothetical protein IPI30_13480 [Saprospiraceae bacterium]|nr:hypothetical protein [Candidatus Vicinibacter affinis]